MALYLSVQKIELSEFEFSAKVITLMFLGKDSVLLPDTSKKNILSHI